MSNVLDKVPLRVTGKGTITARIWFFSSVNSDVSLKVMYCWKSLWNQKRNNKDLMRNLNKMHIIITNMLSVPKWLILDGGSDDNSNDNGCDYYDDDDDNGVLRSLTTYLKKKKVCKNIHCNQKNKNKKYKWKDQGGEKKTKKKKKKINEESKEENWDCKSIPHLHYPLTFVQWGQAYCRGPWTWSLCAISRFRMINFLPHSSHVNGLAPREI